MQSDVPVTAFISDNQVNMPSTGMMNHDIASANNRVIDGELQNKADLKHASPDSQRLSRVSHSDRDNPKN